MIFIKKTIAIIATTLLLVGCSKGINEQTIIIRMGLDYTDSMYVLSLKTLNVQNALGADEVTTNAISSVGISIEQAISNATLLLESKPYFSHADSIILGASIAKTDISPVINYFNKNKDFRLSTAIFITENASDVIYNGDDKIHPSDLIERIEKAGEKITELFELNRKILETSNYTLPYLSIVQNKNEKEYAILNKMATFKDNKLIEIE